MHAHALRVFAEDMVIQGSCLSADENIWQISATEDEALHVYRTLQDYIGKNAPAVDDLLPKETGPLGWDIGRCIRMVSFVGSEGLTEQSIRNIIADSLLAPERGPTKLLQIRLEWLLGTKDSSSWVATQWPEPKGRCFNDDDLKCDEKRFCTYKYRCLRHRAIWGMLLKESSRFP